MAEKKNENFGMLRTLAGIITERFRWFGTHGQTFDGKRNLYDALGYKKILFPLDYRSRYERNGVAQRIVETFPKACWRGGANLFEDEDPDTETAFEKAFDELEKQLHVWSVFERVDTLAGLGRYGIILIGGPGELDTPLKSCSLKQLAYLTPLSEEDAIAEDLDTDPKSKRFGLPQRYAVRRLTNAVMSTSSLSRKVHFSRVIHVPDGVLDEPIFGKPRLQGVWNLLDDLEKITGGGAEAFWKRGDAGIQLELDPEVEFGTEEKAALETEIEKYTHGLERIFRTRGIKANRLGSDVADFKGPASAIFDQLSAATGIPQRILMGSERGELASSTDRSNFNDQVSDRRHNFCENVVIRPFIERLIELGTLPEPEQYAPDWPDLNKLDESKRAAIAVQISSVNTAFDGKVITAEEMRERYLDLPPLTDDQQAELDAQAEEKKQAELDHQTAQAKIGARFAEVSDPAAEVAALADRAADVILRAAIGNGNNQYKSDRPTKERLPRDYADVSSEKGDFGWNSPNADEMIKKLVQYGGTFDSFDKS